MACSGSENTISVNSNPNVQSIPSVDYSYLANVNNPMDSVGARHNEIMHYILVNANSIKVYNIDNSLNEPATYSKLADTIYVYTGRIYGETASRSVAVNGISLGVNNFGISDNDSGRDSMLVTRHADSVISSTSFSLSYKTLYREITDKVALASNADTIVNIAIQYENSLASNSSLTTNEKYNLYCVLSVAKYSAKFWETEVSMPLNGANLKGNHIMKPARVIIAGLTSADFTGAYFGFLAGIAGTPAAMGVGALLGGLGGSAAMGIGYLF